MPENVPVTLFIGTALQNRRKATKKIYGPRFEFLNTWGAANSSRVTLVDAFKYRGLFHRVQDYRNCHGMFQQMYIFCAVKLPFCGTP